MKNKFTCSFVIILLNLFLSFNSKCQINLNNLSDYGIFAKDSIFLESQISINGRAGAKYIDNIANLSANSNEINSLNFQTAKNDLDSLINELNSISYTNISLISSGQNYFTPGTYLHIGNITLNDLIHFSGNVTDTFVIKIDGDLVINGTCGFDLGIVKPSNVFIFVNGNIEVNTGSALYGSFISNENITLGNNIYGNFSILSNRNIIVQNSPLNGETTILNSINTILNSGENIYKLGGSGFCSNVSTIGGSLNDYTADIAVDPNGNYYVTGTFSGTANIFTSAGNTTMTALTTNDMFVCKYDLNGVVQWVKQAHQFNAGNAWGTGIAFYNQAGTDYIISIGYFDGFADFGSGNTFNASNGSAFIWKMEANNGNFVSLKQEGNNSSTTLNTICLDGTGQIYVGGTCPINTIFSNGQLTSGNDFIAKYDFTNYTNC